MKVLLLAAGRGKRLRPLTDHCPKPLVKINGIPLIEHAIIALARQGFHDLVINHGWLGEHLVAYLQDGSQWGVRIRWSDESSGILGTVNGIRQALSILGRAPFLAINGDIWTDYRYTRLRHVHPQQAHLVLVPNPPHNPDGDFVLSDGYLRTNGRLRLTYSGIAVFEPALFDAANAAHQTFEALLRAGADTITAEKYDGHWYDVGTQQRWQELNNLVAQLPPASSCIAPDTFEKRH